jgi:hypothetical protein
VRSFALPFVAAFLAACLTSVEPAERNRQYNLTPIALAEVRILHELPASGDVIWRVRYLTPTPPGRMEERLAVYRAQAAQDGADLLVLIVLEDGSEEWLAIRTACYVAPSAGALSSALR